MRLVLGNHIEPSLVVNWSYLGIAGYSSMSFWWSWNKISIFAQPTYEVSAKGYEKIIKALYKYPYSNMWGLEHSWTEKQCMVSCERSSSVAINHVHGWSIHYYRFTYSSSIKCYDTPTCQITDSPKSQS